MRQSLPIRADVITQLEKITGKMAAHESAPLIEEAEKDTIKAAVQSYEHTTSHENLIIAGVDGTGDFPSISYSDSFVYLTMAQGTCYQSDPGCGLKERSAVDPILELTWLTNDPEQYKAAFDASFASLAGMSVVDVISQSDYKALKAKMSGKTDSVTTLIDNLIRPQPSDTGNVAIQLRSCAELGAALRLIKSDSAPDYVLLDSTYSLPFVGRRQASLFFEHLKRLCCVEARNRNVGFFALSKSHGMPGMEVVEHLVGEVLGVEKGKIAEHWFLRVPTQDCDGWQMTILENRNVPPPGAVSYLVRFHRNTPVMRLDMDIEYWNANIKAESDEATQANERKLFESLDYACHDQRAYGYPYPIKAGHDRASLTNAERAAFRKMIIQAAVAEGMNPKLFRSASQATGHG